MATTTIETNNKLIRFTQEINREVFKESMFTPYMGEGYNAIIRIKRELKAGGEDMNIPMVTRLKNKAVGVTTLVGNEEKIENYGMRVRIDWARNAVTVTKAEEQKDSADIFGEAKPLLSEWTKDLQRDELIAAFMALPTETLPTSSSGVRVNGIQYDLATTTERNTWHDANSDRILYGSTKANFVAGNHAGSLTNLDTTVVNGNSDKFTATNVALMKRIAVNADPRIRPYKTKDGYEHYVAFAGTNTFRDLKLSLETINKDARPRENRGFENNPIFQDGDQQYDGVIIRLVPEITAFVTQVWTTLLTAGAGGTQRVEPVFLCGQQAAVIAWGQMVKPTSRTETDYGFITGVGVDMAYGMAKFFKKHPADGGVLKQWGVVTGFFAADAD